MKAKIHVYLRDSINTDEIIPARYMNSDQEKELAKHALEESIGMQLNGDFELLSVPDLKKETFKLSDHVELFSNASPEEQTILI